MSSTNPTAPSSTSRVGRRFAVARVVSAVVLSDQSGMYASGRSRFNCSAKLAISALAASGVMPGCRRAVSDSHSFV
jgi:hypothetical protein